MSTITLEEILAYHHNGKISLNLTRDLKSQRDLSLAYTPGVAQAVKAIAANPDTAFKLTARSNLVAVVTDGTAILGLGDLGPDASIPVMEGKAVLFKAFADVDGWPVPLAHCRKDGANTGPTDPQRIIDTVLAIAPMYGGINLEDIASPACFEIEDRLDELLDIPVFHDDQWGTAVITLAGLINYATLTDRPLNTLRVIINGAGAAGIRIADMCKAAGVVDLVMYDSKGAITTNRTDLTPHKRRHAVATAPTALTKGIAGAHVFIGVSVADIICGADVKTMANFPAIFAMANPDPEISPAAVAAALGNLPYVMATGRSDYPNQINNVLGFPFIFRGALDVRARTINTAMKVAAAEALAKLARQPVPDSVKLLYPHEQLEFSTSYLIPKPFDRRLFVEVSHAVATAAVNSGAAPTTDLPQLLTSLQQRSLSLS